MVAFVPMLQLKMLRSERFKNLVEGTLQVRGGVNPGRDVAFIHLLSIH